MEADASGKLALIFRIALKHQDFLGLIRHWASLDVAMDESYVWLRGVTEEQEKSMLFKRIPYLESFFIENGFIFPKGGKVPIQKVPKNLYWEQLYLKIPIQFPKLNHNFFGLQEKVKIKLVPSAKRHEVAGLWTEIDTLKDYVLKAPKIRLKNLLWVIIGDKALVFGKPLLPIKGQSFWLSNKHLLPTGYDFNFSILSKQLAVSMLKEVDGFVVWQPDNNYFVLRKDQLKPLRISALRLTLEKIDSHDIA